MVDREEFDVGGMSREEMAGKLVVEMMKCRVCGKKTEGADEVKSGEVGGVMKIGIKYTCEHCGEVNSPVAEVE